MNNNNKEKNYEAFIEHVLKDKNHYQKYVSNSYNKKNAIEIKKTICFIEKTQKDEWDKFKKLFDQNYEENFYKIFQSKVDELGLIEVLRKGVSYNNITLYVCAFKNNTSINKSVIEKYESNIIEYSRQFFYSEQNNNSIDIVILLNGIPIIAIELKKQTSKQNVHDAIKQYKSRNNNEFCFRFNNRFLVYFAVDSFEVYMTTQLKENETHFLPFNMGSNESGNAGGKGNPDTLEYPTSYLFENVLNKDILMLIIQRFIHCVKPNNKNSKHIEPYIIFPRYHQLDAVLKLVSNAKEFGAGKNYLIQHSAGSGKSNSIAWLAYNLVSLHDDNDKRVFNSIIVVTDRIVLDEQIERTIMSFEHQIGLVVKANASKDLRDAIINNKEIIITTIQKFPMICKEVDNTNNKKYAVIIDEAHSSQSGKTSNKLTYSLLNKKEEIKSINNLKNEKTEEENKDADDYIIEEMIKYGKKDHISFFAFTATPKAKTLEIFGEKQDDGTFKAFHIYSMRQAIEEKFIFDVLLNYTTYTNYYKIANIDEENYNPILEVKKASSDLKKFLYLNDKVIGIKTKEMLKIFNNTTKNKIDAKAKAMLVTSSREQALKYYKEFKKVIEENNYNIGVLVAFSGVLNDNGKEIREKDINKISEHELPEKFKTDEYSILIAANKYQTGFDEKLLHTMFVDKKLNGVNAVQTLSRLNRICNNKSDTLIIDFVNDIEDIKNSFAPFYEASCLNESFDQDILYQLRDSIKSFNLYNENDIEKVINCISNFENELRTNEYYNIELDNIFRDIIFIYNDKSDEDKSYIKKTIRNFLSCYDYVKNIIMIIDFDLVKEYIFLDCMNNYLFLSKENNEDNILNIEKLKLDYYELRKNDQYTLELKTENQFLEQEKISLKPSIVNTAEDFLNEIINKINNELNLELSNYDLDLLNNFMNDLYYNEELNFLAKNSSNTIFNNKFETKFSDKFAEPKYNSGIFEKAVKDILIYNSMKDIISKNLYARLKT